MQAPSRISSDATMCKVLCNYLCHFPGVFVNSKHHNIEPVDGSVAMEDGPLAAKNQTTFQVRISHQVDINSVKCSSSGRSIKLEHQS